MTTFSAKLLHELLDLDVKTGKLFWKHRDKSFFPTQRSYSIWNTRFAGKEALTASASYGYKHGYILSKKVKAHHVVWAMVHGSWPDHYIDHLNGETTDNRPCNLRKSSPVENCKNRKMQSNNSSGITGILQIPQSGKWRARVGKHHIGCFATAEAAIAARKQELKLQGYTERHGGAQ